MGAFMVSVVLLALWGCGEEEPPTGCENSEKVERFVDADGDGFGNPEGREVFCPSEVPPGFVENTRDCDDSRSSVSPDALETCDGIDNDCDEIVDENLREYVYFEDLDGDGFGNFLVDIEACAPPPGFVENMGDCDDLNGQINPDAIEICNGGTDDNCNLLADDADPSLDRSSATVWYYDLDEDGYGGLLDLPFPQVAIDQAGLSNPFQACVRPVKPESLSSYPGNFVGNVDDCDDSDALVNPDGVEVCNRYDDDCDNLIDDTDPDLDPAEKVTFWADEDGDGAGDASAPVEACFQPWFTALDDTDCDDDEPLLQGPTGWLLDEDGDGFGAGVPSDPPACTPPAGDYVLPALGEDCEPTDPLVYPGAAEVCDTLDNDCDGDIDLLDDSLDLYTTTAVFRDVDGDGFGNPEIEGVQCGDPLPGYVADNTDCDDANEFVSPGQTEVCNGGIDDDCSGLADEDDPYVDLSTAITWYFDGDDDGFGNPALSAPSCEQPPYYVDNDIDCDDADPYSGAQVAWWRDRDGDGIGAGVPTAPQCGSPGSDYVPAIGAEDCADNDLNVYPGAPDVCGDGADFDCNGLDQGLEPCSPDTCADAGATNVYGAGDHTIYLEFAALSLDLPVLSCIGNLTGPDTIVPVTLGAGELLTATAVDDDDLFVAVVSDCGTGTCLLGSDGGTSDSETTEYLNTTGGVLDAYVVVGCLSGSCADATLDLSIGAPADFVGDTCTEAQALTPYTTGAYALSSDMGVVSDIQLPGGNGCTGTPTGGRELLVPVTLTPGQQLLVDYDATGGDGSLLLVSDCADPENTCRSGVDAVNGPGTESLSYTNGSGSAQQLQLVFDCRTAACTDVTASLIIR
jgi:hypothetical protein